MTKTQQLNEAIQQKELATDKIKELIEYIESRLDSKSVGECKLAMRVVQGRLGLIEDALWGINQ